MAIVCAKGKFQGRAPRLSTTSCHDPASTFANCTPHRVLTTASHEGTATPTSMTTKR
jgi:hypothetical protein